MTNYMDLDYRTQNVQSQSKNLLIAHYRPRYYSGYYSSAFICFDGFYASEGRGPILRIIILAEFISPFSENLCPSKHKKYA